MGALPHSDPAAPAPQPSAWEGLTEQEAVRRLREEGFNELPSAGPRNIFAIAVSVLREPMLLLLVGAGAVYVLLGEPREAVPLLVAIFVIIGITLYQERKTERALQALRDLSSPRALVIREGVRKRIPGREVARGDLVLVQEGDRVPADAVLLEDINLSVDESLLTGESVPVSKSAVSEPGQLAHDSGLMEISRPGGDHLPFVFSGTLVVRGHGAARVLATGPRTELGKIGKFLETLQPQSTRVQLEINRLVKIFVVAGVSLCVFVALIYGFTHTNWLQGMLVGITLAISMVPEEFPVVLTIFLALGAWRMSRQRVLTRRMPAIETLGSATVLCVDKTGTLTVNRMSVRAIFAEGRVLEIGDATSSLSGPFHQTLEYSVLASRRDPFDPMEKAFFDLASRVPHALHPDWTLLHEYPLSSRLPVMSCAWVSDGCSRRVIAAKGAPEAVLQLSRLAPDRTQELLAATEQMAARGLRVLGVARAELEGELPAAQTAIPFTFVGLIGLADPVRPSAPLAVEECYRAGVRVIMITGDYPVTAQNIARQIHLRNPEKAIAGAELDSMSQAELQSRVREVNIFARVVPEQKLRLVQALKAEGEVVAMTGDGVNDAPALKAADIGIAMGARGTDVAREAAALVLLDDDFSSMVKAIRLGRRIYDNLKKVTSYLLAVHVPIAGVTLIPVLLRWPLVLLPLHVVFLELIIDPTCSIAFEAEPEETDLMRRPPRHPSERMFTRSRVLLSLLQGLTVTASALLVYFFALRWGHDETDSRALAFSTLIVGNIALIFTNRSWSKTIWESWRVPNRALWWVAMTALLVLVAILYVPFLRNVFRFSLLHPMDVLVACSAGLAGVLWFEALKFSVNHLRRGRRAEALP
jgi:P-type Ca2+ transporter type 2C